MLLPQVAPLLSPSFSFPSILSFSFLMSFTLLTFLSLCTVFPLFPLLLYFFRPFSLPSSPPLSPPFLSPFQPVLFLLLLFNPQLLLLFPHCCFPLPSLLPSSFFSFLFLFCPPPIMIIYFPFSILFLFHPLFTSALFPPTPLSFSPLLPCFLSSFLCARSATYLC